MLKESNNFQLFHLNQIQSPLAAGMQQYTR
jgi:hypothetical protein